MWVYQKMLQYPAGTVSTCNPKLAKDIITQYGGPDGELAASLRYLTQRYTMPIPEAKAALTDIGTEELAHMEIVATLVYQLVRDASVEQIIAAGMDGYYADHDKAILRRPRQGSLLRERRRSPVDRRLYPVERRPDNRHTREHGR